MVDATCKSCGATFTENAVGCPCCQSKMLDTESGTFVLLGMQATATVTRHWTTLLDTAQQLFDQGFYGAAIVVAHTACEVVAQRAISKACDAKGVPYLVDAFAHLRFRYSLNDSRARQTYGDLTADDKIGDEPFWSDYVHSVTTRNKIVHHGKNTNKQDAASSLKAARDFIRHIESKNSLQ